MGYLFLLLTIISEATAIVLMKLSNGFEHKGKAALALLAFAGTYVFLTLALRQLPASLSNAIWAGASTIIVAVAGVMIFKEHITTIQVFFLALIIIGMAGFNYFQRS